MGKQSTPENWEFINVLNTSITHTANDGSTIKEIQHNLSYIPVVFGTFEYDNAGSKLYRMSPVALVNTSGVDEGLVYEAISLSSDASVIRIVLATPDITNSRYSSSFSIPTRIFIFKFKADA